MKRRIDFLDGMRGLAILLVVAFHAYARWPEIVPYAHRFEEIALFKYGWMGVQLFFMISGFVIFMSLDNSKGILNFVKKRWLRLFPAMLTVTLLVYMTLPLFPEGPTKHADPVDLIPGLTFISHTIWSAWLHIPVKSLEGPFWSLYVEFEFYVIAALTYFLIGRNFLIPILVTFYTLALFSSFSHHLPHSEVLATVKNISETLSFEHFGWFATGAAFYLFYTERKKKWFYIGWAIGLLSVLILRDAATPVPLLFGLSLLLIFSFSLITPFIQKFLNRKLLLFFGFVSYPLYLMHENAMVALIVKSGKHFPWLPDFLHPFVAVALLLPIAYVIARYIEPKLKNLLNNQFQKIEIGATGSL
ncbi:acyltransferase [Hydrogenimonas sp. SS33]|uniref:acyltransferase family protein n=1 Tax=Hydrogenimonas leucolamina TaxID=2954236 RepID=UPI00336BCDAC